MAISVRYDIVMSEDSLQRVISSRAPAERSDGYLVLDASATAGRQSRIMAFDNYQRSYS